MARGSFLLLFIFDQSFCLFSGARMICKYWSLFFSTFSRESFWLGAEIDSYSKTLTWSDGKQTVWVPGKKQKEILCSKSSPLLSSRWSFIIITFLPRKPVGRKMRGSDQQGPLEPRGLQWTGQLLVQETLWPKVKVLEVRTKILKLCQSSRNVDHDGFGIDRVPRTWTSKKLCPTWPTWPCRPAPASHCPRLSP